MIDLRWLSDRLVYVLRWQLDRPYAGAMELPDAPVMPAAGWRVWRIFNDLNRTRGGGMGPAPLSHQEIESWSRLHREPVRPFELDIIRALDTAWLEAAAEMAKGDDRPRIMTEKVTPELVDRLFG
jgi:hypothetical protein